MKKQCIPTLLCLVLFGTAAGKTIPNNAIADLVLGHPDFISNPSPSPYSAFNMGYANAVVVDPITRKVFVSDDDGDRVLRYPNASALTNGAGAEAVFGQARFSTEDTGSGELQMNNPQGLFFDRKGRLWVADSGNNRVLMFEAASFRSNQPFPDRVVGQPDFTTGSTGTTSQKMSSPKGVWVDGSDGLWVADTNNNRVLHFPSISTAVTSNAVATRVLGQALFTTSVAGAGSSGLQAPTSVNVTASGTLFVVCRNAHRVMRFNNAALLGNGAGANAVLGQPDFATVTSGLSAVKLSQPFGSFITADDSLWVSDASNNRILRFDLASTLASGAAATGVVGQPGFVTNASALTNRGLNFPGYGPFVDATGSLWVPEQSNQRVLRFQPDVTKPLLAVTSVVPKTTPKKKLLVSGTASDAFGISAIRYQIGTGPLQTATGTTSWQFNASLAEGKNKITIFAVDSVGNVSLNKVIKVKRVPKAAKALLAATGN